MIRGVPVVGEETPLGWRDREVRGVASGDDANGVRNAEGKREKGNAHQTAPYLSRVRVVFEPDAYGPGRAFFNAPLTFLCELAPGFAHRVRPRSAYNQTTTTNASISVCAAPEMNPCRKQRMMHSCITIFTSKWLRDDSVSSTSTSGRFEGDGAHVRAVFALMR